MNLYKTATQKLAQTRNREGGFSIAEIMVAFVLIAITLLATAYGVSFSFRSASLAENESKVNGLMNETVSIIQQAPYSKLAVQSDAQVSAALRGPGKCLTQLQSVAKVATPAKETVANNVDQSQLFPGLTACRTFTFATNQTDAQGREQARPVGATFYITLHFTETHSNLAASGWDSGNASTYTNRDYNDQVAPKRAFITVQWQQVGATGLETYTRTRTFLVSPSVNDCRPSTIPLVPGADATYAPCTSVDEVP